MFITVCSLMVSGTLAAYEWSNHISIQVNSMQWQYTENISGLDSYVYKYDIDKRQGNKDDFVSAWELLKKDKQMRDKFRTSIEQKMDVKINNSSNGIEILDIDASLSDRALGPDETLTSITNTFVVNYRFEEGLFQNSSTLWLLGEPDSRLSVRFPEGTGIISTRGIDNVSLLAYELSGRFANDPNQTLKPGEAEITYHINQTSINNTDVSTDPSLVALVDEDVSVAPTPTLPIPFIPSASILLIITVAVIVSKH
ncbi:MAG: hypothetical protein P1P80_05700 [ANME-2 cluster archaeon]|nr:hypothetical protein [ANME-2 cluster archaeon]